MDFPQLRAIVVLAEELNFVRAAKRLNISQPALTQRLQRAEEEVGTELFARNQRRVELTQTGRIFAEAAHSIVMDLEHAVHTARSFARGEIGRLRIGFVENASFHLLPRAATEFRRRHPQCGIELHEMISSQIVEALSANRIDIGILRPIEHDYDLEQEVVMSERYAVAISNNHELADKQSASLQEIAKLPLIIAPGRKATYLKSLFGPYFEHHGYEFKIAQEVAQLPAIIAFVGAGMGYTLLPYSATGLTVPGVTYLPLSGKDAPEAEMILSWRATEKSALLHAMLDICRAIGHPRPPN